MDDHDLLIRIDERLDYMEKALQIGIETDRVHDERLRCIEDRHSKIMTYVILIGSVAGALAHSVLILSAKLWGLFSR